MIERAKARNGTRKGAVMFAVAVISPSSQSAQETIATFIKGGRKTELAKRSFSQSLEYMLANTAEKL